MSAVDPGSRHDVAAFDEDGAGFVDSSVFIEALESLGLDGSSKENIRPGEEGRGIDEEIRVVEGEIACLSGKLKELHLKKAARGGRIVPMRSLERKALRRKEDVEPNRRGVSLCPEEICSAVTIIAGSPVIRSGRKSWFWNLDEIDELRVMKERRKSLAPMSLSPNAGRVVPKAQAQPRKLAMTSIGSRKGGKKEGSMIALIRPKRLFEDAGEVEEGRDGPARGWAKAAVKPSRVVTSRYNRPAANTVGTRSAADDKKEQVVRVT